MLLRNKKEGAMPLVKNLHFVSSQIVSRDNRAAGCSFFCRNYNIDCEKIYFCNLRATLPARFSTNQDLPLYDDGECCV